MWARTNQCIYYTDDEQLAVADNFIASNLTRHQQVPGRALIANGIGVGDENAMYAYEAREEMIWLYDDRADWSARTSGRSTPPMRRSPSWVRPTSSRPRRPPGCWTR
jgi:hypothetical protein